MPTYFIPAGYESQRQSLLYGPPPSGAQYGAACAGGAVTGLVISAIGIGELTLGVGSLVSAGIGCGVGALIMWGTYADENVGPMLQQLDLLNDARDLVTSASEGLYG